MTQTISAPEETFASWRPPALRGHERRTTFRKAPEQLIYLSLPSNNGGIVLDISEGGLGLHSIAPVERDGPIHFRFAIDSGAKIRGVGAIAWIDKTGKTGGLRFTQLPDELREQIRVWTGKSTGTATETQKTGQSAMMTSSGPPRRRGLPAELPVGLSTGASTPALGAASAKDFKYSLLAGVAGPVSQGGTELVQETKLGVVSMAGTLVAESVNQPKIVDDTDEDVPSVWEARNPLLYNSTPPIYSAPYNKMSLFPLNPGAEAEAAAARMRDFAAAEKPFAALETAARLKPFAAIVLTVLFALVVSLGIFSYLLTSGVGDLLLSWGQEISRGPQSPAVLRNHLPIVNPAPDSSRGGGQ